MFEIQEYRNNRFFAYTTRLDPGIHEFAYLIRVTHDGLYSVRPSTAFEFYEPAVFGRTAGEEFAVGNVGRESIVAHAGTGTTIVTGENIAPDVQSLLENIAVFTNAITGGIEIQRTLPDIIATGVVEKVTVTSCKGSHKPTYDTPFTLQ